MKINIVHWDVLVFLNPWNGHHAVVQGAINNEWHELAGLRKQSLESGVSAVDVSFARRVWEIVSWDQTFDDYLNQFKK